MERTWVDSAIIGYCTQYEGSGPIRQNEILCAEYTGRRLTRWSEMSGQPNAEGVKSVHAEDSP